jgi:hypothetical protein
MGEVGQPWADVQTSHNAGNTAAGKVTPVSEFKDAIYPKRLPSYAVPDEMKKRKRTELWESRYKDRWRKGVGEVR